MKRKIFFLAFAALGLNLRAQESKKAYEFSLKQSIEYAFQNQPSVLNATLDEEIAKAKVKEVAGIGYPQISAGLDVKKYLELPTSVLPAGSFSFPGMPPIPPNSPPQELKFGLPHSATASIDGSWLLLDASYLISKQGSKTYLELAKRSAERTKIATAISISKAYYNVLITEERSHLIDANVSRLKKLVDDTKALNENGFAEKIDLNRVMLSYNNVLTEQQKVHQFLSLSYTLLKFQLGMDLLADLKLTDKLSDGDFQNFSLSEGQLDYTKRVEYNLLQSQIRYNQLDLKRNKFAYLPSLVAYGTFATQAQREKFNYFNPHQYNNGMYDTWYPFSLIGAKLNVPIFDGFQKANKVRQARLALQKSENDLKTLTASLDVDIQTSKINLNNSLSSLKLQKENMALAEEVYRVSKIKYDQGVGSNLEVINAEASLKEAQTNYYGALYDAYVSKLDYTRATGDYKF